MAYADNDPFYRRVEADPATIRPYADCVLVRPIDDPTAPRSPIIPSATHMTKDGRWRSDRAKGNQYGEVVAVGPGDKLLVMYCRACFDGDSGCRVDPFATRLEGASSRTCRNCGGPLTLGANGDGTAMIDRAEMHVKVGDVIIFPRVPANEIEVNGESMVFLREIQHVLAVVEGVSA